jgi:cell division septal protein FtsQ
MRIPAARLLPRPGAFVPRLRVPRILRVHWKRRLVALALVLAVLGAAYFAWFRDSSLVRVERVTVEGLSTTPGAPQLRSRLVAEAKRMTTLHLDAAALHRLVAGHPVVHSIEARADFPHGLTIHVVENRPVALLSAGDRSVPVAADGTLLDGVEVHTGLPTLETVGLPDGTRLAKGGALDRVTVAGAAPPALLERVESITIQPEKGFVAQIHDGPAIWLGGNSRLRAKWAAAAAVLAQESSVGASYVDVRIPHRGIAGGLSVTEEPQADPADAAPVPSTDGTTAPPAPVAPAAPDPAATPPPAPTAPDPAAAAPAPVAPGTPTYPQP